MLIGSRPKLNLVSNDFALKVDNIPIERVTVYRRGHWDFRFCGFGYFLDRFFGFCAKRLWFFGFGVHCGLRIFRLSASGFRLS